MGRMLMSDEDEDGTSNGDEPPNKNGIDLAKLNDQLEAQGYGGLGTAGEGIRKAMEDMERQMKPFRALQEHIKALQVLPEQDSAFAKLAERAKSFSAAQEAMQRSLGPIRDLQDRMKTLGLAAGEDSAIGRLSKQIADQQRAIDAMKPIERDMPRLHDIAIPPSPIHETNERLERIEERFEQMQAIATDAARIATGLQAAAAEFLQEFEKAAEDNDCTASRAIWIGVAAIIIAVAMPTTQIVYSEYRREPSNGPEIQAALEGTQAELRAMRAAQAAASERFGEALASSDEDTVTILRDIHTLLSQGAVPPVPLSEEPLQ
jgi:DNA repair exonuclease SbcCD ATPase subunit